MQCLTCLYMQSLIGKMTMEVILSTAFGRSIDIQGGQGEELVREIGNRGKWAVPMQMLRFMLCKYPSLPSVSSVTCIIILYPYYIIVYCGYRSVMEVMY